MPACQRKIVPSQVRVKWQTWWRRKETRKGQLGMSISHWVLLGVAQGDDGRVFSSAMTQTVVLKVGMSCQGCVGAATRVLNKMEGVDSFEVDIKEQKVTVKGNVQPEAVLQTVSKTGKQTQLWEGVAAPAETVAV